MTGGGLPAGLEVLAVRASGPITRCRCRWTMTGPGSRSRCRRRRRVIRGWCASWWWTAAAGLAAGAGGGSGCCRCGRFRCCPGGCGSRCWRGWNRVRARWMRAVLVPGLVAGQAARVPDAVAVSCGGECLTYAGLVAAAAGWRGCWRVRGRVPEAVVAVAMDARVADLVAGAAGGVAARGGVPAGGSGVPGGAGRGHAGGCGRGGGGGGRGRRPAVAARPGELGVPVLERGRRCGAGRRGGCRGGWRAAVAGAVGGEGWRM